ncbi:MAG: hypothetical protein ABIB04_01015 [Patescibacteria group bacterium]
MSDISFIFDAKCRFLGEVATRDGSFSSFTLTHEGETALGKNIKEWQTRGIEIFNQEIIEEQDGTSFRLTKERILARDNSFLNALREWSLDNGYHLLPAQNYVLDCWQIMLSLPLGDQERFAMIYALCRVPESEIGGWKQALEQSVKAVDKEST